MYHGSHTSFRILGFLVRALVSDSASPNRKFYKIVSESVDSFYFTQNPFDRRRRIYLISDVENHKELF